MNTWARLMLAEVIKLRRSMALRIVWVLPLAFILLDFTFFGRFFIGLKGMSTGPSQVIEILPLKAIGAIWAGFFHPLLTALLPALVMRPEHCYSAWKHINALPPNPKLNYLIKTSLILIMYSISLLLVMVGLCVEWTLLASLDSKLSFPFPWAETFVLMGWLLLGSLPLLGLYIWLSNRISSGVVPIVFGVIGLLLNISLSGQEVYPSWQRDLIPWILPYSSAQQAIERREARQEAHLTGERFNKTIDLKRYAGTEVYYLPSGRKVTTTTTIPDFLLLPPPPTPKWVLASFSLGLGVALLGLGIVDAKRNRVL